MNSHKDIPRGKLRRGGIVGFTAAKAGMKKAGYYAKRPFLSSEANARAGRLNDEEIAKTIFDALSVLRGTALKAAQLISMEMETIPEAYRNELAKAANQVPPINKALIRKIIKTGLGKPEEVFARFKGEPFAAASLGQVHEALSHDGDELAVKVQYPGIADGVKSDIDMLKALLRPTKYFEIFASCFDEIHRKVSEELDYQKEAQNTEWFYENLAFDNVIVPKVHRDLSTTTILTISMISGLHLDEWLATGPSKEERDNYGQLLVDLFNHTLHEKCVIHADPNLGNYLFRDDGKLGLIDFGCIKRVGKDFAHNFTLVTEAYLRGDLETVRQLHRNLGILYKQRGNEEEFMAFYDSWLNWLTKPFRQEYFDFSNSDDYFNNGIRYAKELYHYMDRYDGMFVYFGRAEHGLLRILQRLGARVRMRYEL
ncbi:MAG: AarF/ABC1/UbiB kinase family protein [Deltaproteobacteria bacterium]|nr:AarF/ABC1/UbiB kinase family protein [Deltaproteobacteria bacterium]